MHASKMDQQKRIKSANLMLRLILHHDEVFRLPPTSRGVQVVSGVAWLTVDGEDIFLQCGENVWLFAAKDLALVSPLGGMPLILEIFGNNTSSSARRLIAAHRTS